MEICEEAVIAQNNRFSGIKRYDRADFNKWFAEYDVKPYSHLTVGNLENNLLLLVSCRTAVLFWSSTYRSVHRGT